MKKFVENAVASVIAYTLYGFVSAFLTWPFLMVVIKMFL